MFSLSKDWNPKNARLREIVGIPECIDEAIGLTLKLHGIVHASSVSGSSGPTYSGEVFDGIEKSSYSIMPTKKDVTLAWNVWHITRIEDLVANLLIAGGHQVFDGEWKIRLNAIAADTGNAMTDGEIIALSQNLNIDQLFAYRNAVGQKTRSIVSGLTAKDLKRKVTPDGTDQILRQGGVTEHPDSVWLLDFWGRKTIAGLLLMPITRHQIVHLNDCLKLKNKVSRMI
jgi:hypothetical protein